MSTLQETAKALLARGKGILAADESAGTCDKRFDEHGIQKTPEMRRRWRELLFTTPGIEKGLSGVILYDETIRQCASDGTPFPELLKSRGIIPGIKVDKGLVDLPNFPDEKITEGLDGLSKRLEEYYNLGARFTKWRAVIRIGESIPTEACIKANSLLLSQFAARSQEAGLVPTVEPEVLLDGDHEQHECTSVLTRTLSVLFQYLGDYRVNLLELILKSSMALPGKNSGKSALSDEVARETLKAFRASVPKETGGIAFLSGGQTPLEATNNLNNVAKFSKGVPWPITFSYSRALQEPVLAAWKGREENVQEAQAIFRRRVEETSAASLGQFND